MRVSITWRPDHDHARLARWQVRVLARWAADRQAADRAHGR